MLGYLHYLIRKIFGFTRKTRVAQKNQVEIYDFNDVFDKLAKSKAYVEAIGCSWHAKAAFTQLFNFVYDLLQQFRNERARTSYTHKRHEKPI